MRVRSHHLTKRFAGPLVLSAVSLFLAFWQRPFSTFSDTRIELVTDPAQFLGRVTDLWTPTIDLGHIQASQFIGYLFPMAPFFAGLDALGLPMWITQRLWIALLLAVSAWGLVRLICALRPDTGTATTAIAGLIYITSPFVTVTLNRGTVWLIAYATLPWMLYWVHRGVRTPRGWVAPAALALLIAASCAGLTPVIWLLLGALLFGSFEALTSTGFKPLLQLAWRTCVLALLASLWWIVPVLAQARYGTDYLTFTEHPETILHTPSASESLRLLGYWVGYISGYPDPDPQLPAIGVYLLSVPTVLSTFAIPAIAVASLVFLRRWRYGAFFALLLGLAVLAMSIGFPQQSGVGSFVTDLYYSAGPLQFMRTTYKAAPLAALAIACLGGIGIGSAFDYLRSLRLNINGVTRAVWPASVALAVLVGVLIVFWGRPLWAGNAVDPRLFFSSVPTPWVQAIDQAQKATPADSRIAVLPGELFGWYSWGGTQNSIVPGLSEKPVVVRQIVRSASEQAAQLLDSVDARIQQGRLTPGQLPPLLQLMGVGRVLVGTDSSPRLSEALDPARVAAVLAEQPGFQKPAATFGPVLRSSPPPDRGGATVDLAQVRAYAAPQPAYPRISRVHSAQAPTVVDGDADGIIAMAGVGALDPRRASFYAADLTRGSLKSLLADGATLTFTDSNRRRGVLVSKLTTNTGPTLGASDPLSREFPDYDPFSSGGAATRTVAVYSGLSSLFSPVTPGFTLFPEHRPFAAFDGRFDSSWITQERDPARRYLQLNLKSPISIDSILVRPHRDSSGSTRRVFVSANGLPERLTTLKPGWNRVLVANANVKSLRLRVPRMTTYYGVGPGGLDEVRIPGLRIEEALRLPTRLSGLAAGQDLSRAPFDIITERVTADFPRRAGKASGAPFALDPVDMSDAELGMRRLVNLPAQRRFEPSGWGSVSPQAQDSAIDQLAGVSSVNRYTSSDRFEGLPINRASSAFDQDPKTAWIAEYSSTNNPSIRWRGSQPITVKRLRLRRLPGRYLRPTRVTVGTPNGGFDLPVGSGGVVELPTAVSTQELKLTIRSVKRPARTRRGERVPRSVAISEIEAAGLPAVHPRRSGPFASGCGAARIEAGGSSVAVSVEGQLQALDGGQALAVKSCGAATELQLRKGQNLVVAVPGRVFAIDALRLHGAAPLGAVPAAAPAALMTVNGRVGLSGAGWLVLGESYSPGWRAWCKNRAGEERELGAPRQIDGFANGWRIDGRSCLAARFAFGPRRLAEIAYFASGLAGLGLLLFLAFSVVRRRKSDSGARGDQEVETSTEVVVTTTDGLSLVVAPSSNSQPQLGLRLDRSSSKVSCWLFGIAALGILAVGALYVVNPDVSAQGINFDYPLHHLAAHYLALISMVAVVAGAVSEIVAWARRGPDDC